MIPTNKSKGKKLKAYKLSKDALEIIQKQGKLLGFNNTEVIEHSLRVAHDIFNSNPEHLIFVSNYYEVRNAPIIPYNQLQVIEKNKLKYANKHKNTTKNAIEKPTNEANPK